MTLVTSKMFAFGFPKFLRSAKAVLCRTAQPHQAAFVVGGLGNRVCSIGYFMFLSSQGLLLIFLTKEIP